MTLTEIKAIIQEQLPILLDDPAIKDFVLRTVSEHHSPKKEIESNFERMMTRIDIALAEIKRVNDENERKWEESKAESERKWEESKAESERKWDEQMKLNNQILVEIKEMNRKHDSSIGALGARWGLHAEATFRNTLQTILEGSFGVQVLNVTEFDDMGEVFGRPDQIELDIIIKNGLLILCEIKSSMSKSDMLTFHKKILFYEKRHNRTVNRKIVSSPMVDAKALKIAKEFGIEIYSHGETTI